LLLYQNMVIEESGAFAEAVAHLEQYSDQIYDKLTLLETKGKLYLQLKQFDKAEKVYHELLKRNQENTLYYFKLLEAKQLTDVDQILELFKKFQEEFPRALAPQRLPLNYATGTYG